MSPSVEMCWQQLLHFAVLTNPLSSTFPLVIPLNGPLFAFKAGISSVGENSYLTRHRFSFSAPQSMDDSDVLAGGTFFWISNLSPIEMVISYCEVWKFRYIYRFSKSRPA